MNIMIGDARISCYVIAISSLLVLILMVRPTGILGKQIKEKV